MDPATAIGVASGVIAFVDFSWKLITGAKGLYDKGETQTAENVRIGKIIKDLKEFSLDLDGGSLGTSKHEKALKALATNCGDLCQELIGILEKLKAKKNSRWETLKTTWASMRKADDISDIERRLGEYRAEMNTRLLALINEQQSGLKSQLDTIQSQAERLLSSSGADLKQLRSDFVNLLQKLEEENDDASSVSSAETSARPELFNSLNEISSSLSRLEGLMRTTPKEIRILEHLYFEGIFTRLDSIEQASEKTFEWILMTDSEYSVYIDASTIRFPDESFYEISSAFADFEPYFPDTRPEPDGATLKFALPYTQEQCMSHARRIFQDWLSSDSGIFHISGKAGCGKSTLLKLIVGHKKTTVALESWAGRRKLILASFFFWRSDGDRLQMSLDGMRRSILFSTLRQCPHLIPMVLPQQWQHISANPSSKALESDLFRAPKIDEAFDRLLALSNESDNMELSWCLFIDGLDEYDASEYDQRLFARKLRDWAKSSSVKICVTSRPEVQFLDTFPSHSRIHLHELTSADIYQSARHSFEKDEVFPRVSKFYLDLIRRIVELSEGVFLWARLVVKLLITEAGLHSDYSSLRAKLRCTPTQLDDLYDSLFSSFSRNDRRKVYYLLLLVATNPFKIAMNSTVFDYIGPEGNLKIGRRLPEYNYYNVAETQERLSRQIQNLTRGLLFLVPAKSDDAFFELGINKIRFFHKTVRDYILTSVRMAELSLMFPEYNRNVTHTILLMTEISRMPLWYCDAEKLAPHFMEALSTEAPLNHEAMQIMELVWEDRMGCLRGTFDLDEKNLQLATIGGFPPFEKLFPAVAVFYGHSQYLEQYLDQTCASEGPCSEALTTCSPPCLMPSALQEDSSLLLSAILSLSNTSSNRNNSVTSISMLMLKGHSMKKLALIMGACETTPTHVSSLVSLWMIFLYQLEMVLMKGSNRDKELHLKAFEKIISLETQEMPYSLWEGKMTCDFQGNKDLAAPTRIYVSTVFDDDFIAKSDFQLKSSGLSDFSPSGCNLESRSVPVFGWVEQHIDYENAPVIQFVPKHVKGENCKGCKQKLHDTSHLQLYFAGVVTKEEALIKRNPAAEPLVVPLW